MAKRPDRTPRRRRVAGQRSVERPRAGQAPEPAPYPLAPTDAPIEPPTSPLANSDPVDVPRTETARPGVLTAVRRGGWRRSWVPVLPALAVLGLVLAVLAFFLHGSYADDVDRRDSTRTGDAAAKAARAGLVAALSYDYRHFDADIEKAEAFLTPTFKDEYHKTSINSVRRGAIRYKASVQADVVAAAPISVNGDRVTVLAFVDQTATNTKLSAPRIDKNRVRVQMREVDGHWLIDQLDPI